MYIDNRLFHCDIQENVIKFKCRSFYICDLCRTKRHLTLTGTYFATHTMPKSRDVRRLDWHRRSHQQYCRPWELENKMTCLQMEWLVSDFNKKLLYISIRSYSISQHFNARIFAFCLQSLIYVFWIYLGNINDKFP